MADIIRVALFDDSKVIRDSLGTLLSTTPGIGLCGCYPNAEQLLERIATCKPDVVLMDIDMPGINGIEAMRLLHAQDPKLPVIMLTVFADEDRVFAALCAGAMGYLLKNTDPNELLDAIAEVRQGGAPMTPSIALKALKLLRDPPDLQDLEQREDFALSKRETQVLEELCKGHSYQQIAEVLFIAPATVRKHIENIYRKLQVCNKVQAAEKARKYKLL